MCALLNALELADEEGGRDRYTEIQGNEQHSKRDANDPPSDPEQQQGYSPRMGSRSSIM